MVELLEILRVQLQVLGGPVAVWGRAVDCCAWKLKVGLRSPVGLSSAPHCQGICVRLVGHLFS